MTIIAILLAAGVPAFKNYSWNLRMKAAMDMLQTDLNLARGRAISHNIQTIICPAPDSDDCSGQSAWHDGWIVFSDLNGDRHKQEGEPLLKQRRCHGTAEHQQFRSHAVICASTPMAAHRAATLRSCSVTSVAQADAGIITRIQ